MDKNNLEKQAIGIVAQLFDLAEVPVEKRQQINDTAYDYMIEQLRLHSVVVENACKCEDKNTFNRLQCPKCKPL